MRLILKRFAYTPTETEGVLIFNDRRLYTIEKPWRHNKRNISCIPDGLYQIEPWVRPSGAKVYRLLNPELRVYGEDGDIPKGTLGRSYIYIHIANFADDLLGCIGVGLARGVLMDPDTKEWKRGVLSSTSAFSVLLHDLGEQNHELLIKPSSGAELGN